MTLQHTESQLVHQLRMSHQQDKDQPEAEGLMSQLRKCIHRHTNQLALRVQRLHSIALVSTADTLHH